MAFLRSRAIYSAPMGEKLLHQASPADQPIIAYRPEIDGLRAIAVGLVVLYHAIPTLIPGGFIGVDVFFVISGYLITSIIAKQEREGRFSLAEFYRRRVLRILPPLVAMLAVVLALSLMLLPPNDVRELAKGLFGAATFSANLVFWKETGYFGADAHDTLLLHTWSLAVEEQFYILWPLVAVWASRRRPILLCLLLAVASFTLACWNVAHSPAAAFYMPQDRAWELLLGAALAFLPRLEVKPLAGHALASLASVAIIGSALLLTSDSPFPGLAAAPACLGTTLLILLRADRAATFRVLASPPAVRIGKLSYSLYLWHWPALILPRMLIGRPLSPVEAGAAILLALLAAWLSLTFIEGPARRSKASTRVILTRAAAGLSGAALATVALYFSGGLPQRASAATLAADRGFKDYHADMHRCVLQSSGDRPREGCAFGSGPPRAMVLGDSHAGALVPGIITTGGTVDQVTKNSCAPLTSGSFRQTNECRRFVAAAIERARLTKPDTIIVSARWALLLQPSFRKFLDTPRPLDAAKSDALRTAMTATLAALQEAAPAARVFLIGAIPEPLFHVPQCRSRASYLRRDVAKACPDARLDDYRRWSVANIPLAEAAAQRRVVFVDVARVLCRETCLTQVGGRPLYFDDDHLSATGARYVVSRF